MIHGEHMSEAVDQIPWEPLGEAWWREAGAQMRASEMQTKFAACFFSGMTRTAAAKLSGYSSDEERARKSGSEAAQSSRVTSLLALATAEIKAKDMPPPSPKLMTETEWKLRLSDIAKGPDKALALRAGEALFREKENSSEIGRFSLATDDGFAEWRIVRDHLRLPGGAVAIVSFYMASGNHLAGMPMLHDAIGMLRRDDPEYYETVRRRHSRGGLIEIDRLLANPQWQYEAREKLWREVGLSIQKVEAQALGKTSNGHATSRADALQGGIDARA
jgi:hypothetical protein